MSTSHVRLVLGPAPGGEVVEIDGVDMTNAIRHVTVEAGVTERYVTIQFAMAKVEYDGIQQIRLSGPQIGLLARFGWRPPDGARMNADGSVVLERLADPNDPRREKP